MIELDGSHGEGGGQLVRLAVALGALAGKPLRLVNVRANRARPGLAPQHLAAVRAVASVCEARCEGLELRSTAFSFEPRSRPAGGELRVDVGTAGSVTLVLQALLPILLAARAPSRVVVRGGTDVRQAPTWDYFCHVLLRLLDCMGGRVRASVARRGYYPRGGGEVLVEVEPVTPRPFAFQEKAGSWRLGGAAHVANLPVSIAERMRDAAALALPANAAIAVRTLGRDVAAGTGGAITVWAESEAGLLGASRVAERGVRAEALGQAVGAELAADLAAGAALDVHAADQILVCTAMAEGRSSFTTRAVSSHAHTAMWLLSKFLPVRFSVEPHGALWRVSVNPGRRVS
ncbi:MAG: RNA 3'-terminal-phosphate cyclase [Betaproteobacteria bacterium RIFCSPLOWO2_12_FULL_65_14]|nr:MAG: RNA 3'-terminal-phosphate cyclase [Betaproteobacteria bacterium RIFCSPLOWO2_12_FULL_65_14]